MIYLITKPDFVLAHGAHGQGCVWRISQQANTPHPAPFPPALVNNCLAAIGTGPVLENPRRTIRQGLNGSGRDDQGVQPPGKMTRKCAPLKKAPPKKYLAPKNAQP